MRKAIYNLEFPSWCDEFTIRGHRFYRVPNYEDQVKKLQHLASIHSEFKIEPNSGEHSITAFVDIPLKREKIKRGVMLIEFPELEEIVFLLSLLTCREIFYWEDPPIRKLLITNDHRLSNLGMVLKASIPVKVTSDSIIRFKEISFEKIINEIYEKIRSEVWQKEYGGGFFLSLAKEAFRARTYESAFVQCWTIWEHLFSIFNHDWLSDDAIFQLKAHEKISFILFKYFLKDDLLDQKSKKRIKDLSEIRNRLVHFGKLPEKEPFGDTIEDAVFFIHLTEQLIAKILGLGPSNVFNTMEKLEKFLKGQKLHG